MKIVHFMAAGLAVLLLAYCKSTKPATPAPVPVVTVPAPPPANPSDMLQMQMAEKRWPGTAEMELREGRTIYTTKCVKCHRAYDVEEFSEKKWLHEIDDMSPKAKLTAEEKLKLTKYILSYRDTKEALKGK